MALDYILDMLKMANSVLFTFYHFEKVEKKSKVRTSEILNYGYFITLHSCFPTRNVSVVFQSVLYSNAVRLSLTKRFYFTNYHTFNTYQK